jgi:hypothetical protein
VHPLVAEGLARRGGGTVSRRTSDEEAEHSGGHSEGHSEERSGEIGWPAPPNKGHGLGWPGDLTIDGDEPPAEPAPQARRGWRRLFGARPAA